MHRAHLVHSDRPIVITIVDTAENIERLVPAVAEMMDTGLMASSEVQMIRVEKAQL
jgi:PII-like signaling protein